ncbi:conserved membrane protein, unknown function [Hepatocystis sp. ex Piliocolobus tephrosceles]|nr:conserved membrane protein, unknown function [Hepatocystis sp. ex Piliocolobus tephrosceles]
MCLLCNHAAKGGFENSAIGTWSKGVSLLICSSLFLLRLFNEKEINIFQQEHTNNEYSMIYFLSLYNLIGASLLLVFSLIGHFFYKPLLKPIYLSSFIVSLFLISTGVYTTCTSKNISLKIIGIMDALKLHPEYMLLKKIHYHKNDTNIKELRKKILEGNVSQDDKAKNKNTSVVTKFDATELLKTIEDKNKFLETQKKALYENLSTEELKKIFASIETKSSNFESAVIQEPLIVALDKMKNVIYNIDVYNKFYKFLENNAAYITNSERIKSFAESFVTSYKSYRRSFFDMSNYELVNYGTDVVKIYSDSIKKIKQTKTKNPNAKLYEYIDDLDRRNLLILCSTLIFMSFIYIHKGASLTKKSSISITLLYIPTMSYIICLGCVFLCTGIYFFSFVGVLMCFFCFMLTLLLIFSQWFCERLFKLFMGFIFLFFFFFCLLIGYILVENFNDGLKLYSEYQKHDNNDFYWVLLDKKHYEKFKRYVLFSNGQLFLICIALCVFITIYSLYSVCYTFRSILSRKKGIS